MRLEALTIMTKVLTIKIGSRFYRTNPPRYGYALNDNYVFLPSMLKMHNISQEISLEID